VSTTEDRLRAATRAIARTVEEGSAPELLLPSGHERQSRRRSLLVRWTAPIAAAGAVAAVAVIVAGTLVVGGDSQAPAPVATEPGLVMGGVPPYYVALTLSAPGADQGQPAPLEAVLRATVTGRALATVRPPAGDTFTAVTGAADDQTFVVADRKEDGDQDFPPTAITFYKLTYKDGGHHTSLSQLPIAPEPAGTTMTGMALSADGTRLAVSSTGSLSFRQTIQVINLQTGAQRSWYANGVTGPPDLSTTMTVSWPRGDNTLAFDWQGAGADWQCRQQTEANTVRLLNLARPGHNLIADSRGVATVPRSAGGCFAGYAVITSDGKSVIGPITVAAKSGSALVAFGEFSLATRALTGIVQRQTLESPLYYYQYVLWPGSTGRPAIIQPPLGFANGAAPEVLHGKSVTTLPWSSGNVSAAW